MITNEPLDIIGSLRRCHQRRITWPWALHTQHHQASWFGTQTSACL